MRRLAGVLLVVLALIGVLASAAPASAEVYWRDAERRAAVEPGRVDVFFGAGSYTYATGLDRWRHWGARRTIARGRIWINNCKPYCAKGEYRPHRGKVRLYRIHRCGDRRFYGRIKFLFRNDSRNDFWIQLNCQGYGVRGR